MSYVVRHAPQVDGHYCPACLWFQIVGLVWISIAALLLTASCVLQKLRILHDVAAANNDAQMCDYIESNLLQEQARDVKKVGCYPASQSVASLLWSALQQWV